MRPDPPPLQEQPSPPIAPTIPQLGGRTSPYPKDVRAAVGKEEELEMKILELGKELESSKKKMENKLQATENRLLETENRLLETENRLSVAEHQLCELKGQLRGIPRGAGALDSNVDVVPVRSVPDYDVCRDGAGGAGVEAIEVAVRPDTSPAGRSPLESVSPEPHLTKESTVVVSYDRIGAGVGAFGASMRPDSALTWPSQSVSPEFYPTKESTFHHQLNSSLGSFPAECYFTGSLQGMSSESLLATEMAYEALHGDHAAGCEDNFAHITSQLGSVSSEYHMSTGSARNHFIQNLAACLPPA